MSQFRSAVFPLGASLALAASLMLAGCGGQPTAAVKTAAPAPDAPAASNPPDNASSPAPTPSQPQPGRLFSGAAAAWLYSAPTGSGISIGSIASGIHFNVNAHDGGFDYPVTTTDGTHGCTNFTDTLQYDYGDHVCVPNPANGYWPSVGGWGANDGHLIVIDTSTHTYFDFWKLYVNGSGQPTSTNVGHIVSGSLDGSGVPGTTAANVTGLAGDIMPGELDCDDCLRHALNVIVPGAMNAPDWGHQAPITHSDGSVGGAVFREGAKIRLDPGFDVDSLHATTAAKAIMKALQRYGGLITDQTGGNGVSFYSALAKTPDLAGLDQMGSHLQLYY